MQIEYENLSDNLLTIVDYNLVDTHTLWNAEAQLYPELYTSAGQAVVSPSDLMKVEKGRSGPPLTRELPAGSRLEVLVDYYLPDQMVTQQSGPAGAQPLPPGQYSLGFVYASHGDDNVWGGTISSNQIQVCVTNP